MCDYLDPEKAKKVVIYQEDSFWIHSTDGSNYTEKIFECNSLEQALKKAPFFCEEIKRPDLVDETYILLKDGSEIKAHMGEILMSNIILCLVDLLEFNYGQNWQRVISPNTLKTYGLTLHSFLKLIEILQIDNEKMKSTLITKEKNTSNPEINIHGDKCWYNGKRELHREDGPAIEYSDGTKEWYLNGKCHREDGPAVESTRCKEWYLNGKRHREDGPAIENNGYKQWYLNGELHREDGPACEYPNGNKFWFLNGVKHSEQEFNEKMKSTLITKEKNMSNPEINIHGDKCWYNGKRELHREDGPAVEYSTGDKEWRLNGELHREDGPAVEYARCKEWYLNGKLHREDGPAIEYENGSKFWHLNDKLHREDGPACEYENGTKEWWENGVKYSEQEFNEKMKSTLATKEKTMESMFVVRAKASEVHRCFVNFLLDFMTSDSSDSDYYSWTAHSNAMDILLKATHGKVSVDDFENLAKHGYMPMMLPNFNEVEKHYAEQCEIVGQCLALENLAIVITDDFGKVLCIIPGNCLKW